MASGLAACGTNAENCDLTGTCTTGSAGQGGHGGSIDPGCVPASLPAQTPLPESCAGVFVSGSSGNDTTGTGSRAAPYASVTQALASGATVLYVCAEPTADTSTVTVPPGTTLFGAIDCASYEYAPGSKSTLAPGTPLAMVLAPGAGARIEDFHIEAADAVALGASSIAVLANATASAALTRVELVAGDGADGEAGLSLPDDSSLDGTNGLNGADDATACPPSSAAQSTPGAGGPKTCGGVNVSGGEGAPGLTTAGNVDGAPGNPTPGLGGAAGMGSALNCVLGAVQGGNNAPPAAAGTGATALGTLDATGYTGANGTPGTPGDPGGGGGGGRGAGCTSRTPGPAGGGGASGGCGGAGGGRLA
ncbi:MAG: hypothetical protein HY908_18595 [Myxococcales bacterium]|nr:hypothetical protein [Myxococcales bacterium]